ncbi:hypothetical protein L9F63_025684, partial [Diploptera punctata]
YNICYGSFLFIHSVVMFSIFFFIMENERKLKILMLSAVMTCRLEFTVDFKSLSWIWILLRNMIVFNSTVYTQFNTLF